MVSAVGSQAAAGPREDGRPVRIPRVRPQVRALLSGAEKTRLRHFIEHLEQETSAELCVMLLRDVEDPREFATHYFNHLGIGKKELNNGVLILVVLDKRRIEIVVGKGLEAIMPPRFLKRVINEQMSPHFRDERFGAGLHEAVEALGQVLRAHFAGARPGPHPGAPGKIPDVVDLDQGGRNA